jgi:MFS family permease
MAKGKTFAALKHHNFRVLYPANALSNIGTWAQRVAQDWLVLELTHSAAALGIVTALQFAPSLFFSMAGGVLADRFDKRKLLFLTNTGSMLTSLILGLLVMSHSVNIWHVYVLGFILGLFNALDAPIRQTFTSELVGSNDVLGAISLNSLNFNVGRLIGPGISGLMIAAFGTGPSFMLNATSYLTMMFALGFVRKNELNIAEQPKDHTKMKEAFAYLAKRKDLLIVLVIGFLGGTFGMNYQIFNALMATQQFHKGPAEFGGLGTFLAVGSVIGALLTSRLERFRKPKFVAISAAIFGSALVLLSTAPNYLAYSFLLPLGGCAAVLTFVLANTYVQTSTEPQLRGKVVGIYMTLLMGGTPVGAPLLGWLAEVLDIRWAMAIFGLTTALGSVIAYLLINRPEH